MQAYQYEQFDLSTDALRLFRLRKGNTEPIQCDIFQAFLHEVEGIPYEALSYTWGSSQDQCRIIIDGDSEMEISQNLHIALKSLRLPHEDRILWVDALCINQGDDKEKGHQVRQMRFIYQNSQRVIIWLGESNDDIDRLMAFLESIDKQVTLTRYRYLNSLRPWEIEWQNAQYDYEAILHCNPREGMKQLLQRPWFKRVWTIQEAASAKKAVIACGTHCVASRVFSTIPSLMDINVETHTQAMLDIMPGPRRKNSWWNGDRDLYTLLRQFNNSEASDPRDKIYALLGISSNTSDSDVLIPDYTVPVQTAVKTTILFLLFGDALDLSYYILPDYSLDQFLDSLDELKEKLFTRAMEIRNDQILLQLIKAGLETNLDNHETGHSWSRPPLVLLTENSASHHVIKALLDRGDSDPNVLACNIPPRKTPLGFSVADKDEEVVDAMLTHRKIIANRKRHGEEIVYNVEISDRDSDMIKFLMVKKKIDIWHDDRECMVSRNTAYLNGDTGIVQLFHPQVVLEDSGEQLWQTNFRWAMESGEAESIKLVFAYGSDDFDCFDSRGKTPLNIAISNGDEETVKLLLTHEAIDVNREGIDGMTPLGCAVDARSLPLLELILTHPKAQVDFIYGRKRGGCLWHAAEHGYRDVVEFLVDNGACIEAKDSLTNRTPLCVSAELGHADVVKYFIEKGADFRAKANYWMPGQNEKMDATPLMNATPLAISVRKGLTDIVRLLLNSGIDIESDGEHDTVLFCAVSSGQTEMVSLLIAAGANLEATDATGRTPLSHAAGEGHSEIVELLLRSGANVELKGEDGNGTPLCRAMQMGHLGIARLLLENGADIEACMTNSDSSKRLLWHMAAEGKVSQVRFLVVMGAKLEFEELDMGVTPLEIAVKNGHEEAAKVLFDHNVMLLWATEEGIL